MKLQKSLSTSEKFQLWAEGADLADLKDALTALNLTYQKRVTTAKLHPNQFRKLKKSTDNTTTITVYEGEPDDSPIDENRVWLMLIGCFIYKTTLDFSLYLQKMKREVRTGFVGKPCPECGEVMTAPSINAPSMLTVDHIIPVWVCTALEYYHGIVDPKNMRVMCFACNSARGDRIKTISDLRKDLSNKKVDAFFRKVNGYLPLTFSHVK